MKSDYKLKYHTSEEDIKKIKYSLVKGVSLEKVANRYGFSVSFIKRNFYIYAVNTAHCKCSLGSKSEPYHINEMDYGFIPKYKEEDLNKAEIEAYNKYKLKSILNEI
tara:strand:- start:238 stop:558 length:321 start_codon:yes stop_codon:yes gene_type:complete